MSTTLLVRHARRTADTPCLSTFLKRKGGLFKKAYELGVLCQVDVAVIIFGNNKKLHQFCSGDINDTISRYQFVRPPLLPHEACDTDSTIVWRTTRAQGPG